jgi:hypothetical protein
MRNYIFPGNATVEFAIPSPESVGTPSPLDETISQAPDSLGSSLDEMIGNSVKTIVLRRGQVMNDFINYFMEKDIHEVKKIKYEVQMKSNGEAEAGEDIGGVFRDAISEFWTMFYETKTVGSDMKVPILMHPMTAKHWRACGLVAFLGYKQEHYFPIQLAYPFVKYVVTDPYKQHDLFSTDTLIECFMNFVPEMEKELFSHAIKDFDSVEYAELLDALESHNVRTRYPKKGKYQNYITPDC